MIGKKNENENRKNKVDKNKVDKKNKENSSFTTIHNTQNSTFHL